MIISDEKGGAGGLPLQKIPKNTAKKGGAGGLPLPKKMRNMTKKGGAGGLPLQKRIKTAKRGVQGVSPCKKD